MNPAGRGGQSQQALPVNNAECAEIERQAQEHLYMDLVTPYGKQNKPRYMDPSMFELMQWHEAEHDHTFKASKDALRGMDEYRRYKALVDKANDGYTTESKDNYRKFAYKRLDDPTLHIPFEDSVMPSHDKAVEVAGRPKSGQQRRVNPQEMTEYYDQIASKYDPNTFAQVMRTIEQNDAERHHSKSRSRERVPYTGNFKRSEMLDWPDADEMRLIRQREKEEKEQQEITFQEEMIRRKQEEEEQIRALQRPDYANIQNRLLSYKIDKRRDLDPVKDKDRIERRSGRIKVGHFYREIHGADSLVA